MGFFKDWLGTPKKEIIKPLTIAPEKPTTPTNKSQEIAEKAIHIDGELSQDNFRSESEEGPRVVKCQQIRFGKVLEKPRGGIASEKDHDITQKSADFPRDVSAYLPDFFKHNFDKPRDINIDVDKYPWREEGGELIKKMVRSNGKDYVVVIKRMLRPEDGEAKDGSIKRNGRLYTEAHEIVIPAEEWSVALVPQLSEHLDTWGATTHDFNLQPLELRTDNLDKQLPDGWFDDYVKGLVLNIVSGKPVSVLGSGIKQNEYLDKLFQCLICIPENLARQTSFGAGFFGDVKEGEVRIGQGFYLSKGLRKLDDNWKSSDPKDELFGQKYLTAVENLIAGCKTPREVMKAIKQLPVEIISETEKRFKQT